MHISELKTGMIVHFTNGSIGIVLLDTPNGDIIAGETWFPIGTTQSSNIEEWNSEHTVESILQPHLNSDYGNIHLSPLNCKVIYTKSLDRVEVKDAGPNRRTIYIESKNSDIICIGCFRGTRLEAIDAILAKYNHKPITALQYIIKVNECFAISSKLMSVLQN